MYTAAMAHIHEKIDFTAEVFIVYDGKVLLRKHDKYGIWLSVGGHIELHEDPNQAAVREAQEEVGLDIELWDGTQRLKGEVQGNKQLIPPVSLNRHFVKEGHEHVSMIYFARSKNDEVKPERKEDTWRWLTKEELKGLDLRKDVYTCAVLALEELA